MRTSAAHALLATGFILLAVAVPAHAADAESLLLPGIDMRTIDFTVGAWCRYRVIDEAMGTADTSTVYLAVVGGEETKGGRAYWLKVESIPPGGSQADADMALALIDSRIHEMAPDDSLHDYVLRYFTSKGGAPIEEGDVRELRRLTMASPRVPSDWKIEPGRKVTVPAGTFLCERQTFAATESRDVASGRVVLKQKRSDRVEVFISPDVPLFHLVKSVVERTRETRTVPPVRGIPDAGPKTSRTTSLLIELGSDAKSSIPAARLIDR